MPRLAPVMKTVLRLLSSMSRSCSPIARIARPLSSTSRCQALDPPAIAATVTFYPGAHVAQPVVQPAGPALPELEQLRPHPEPAPARRARHRRRPRAAALGVAGLELGDPGLEHLAARDRPALRRGQGPDPAAVRAAREVGVGLGGGDRAGAALDPHLPV